MTDGLPIRTNSMYMAPRPTDTRATWLSHDSSKFQEILNGNTFRPTVAPVNGDPIWKESCKIRTFIRILSIRKDLSIQETGVDSIL